MFTFDGHNELDASIMDGATRMAGAVCGLTHIKNPVELARAVMEHSEYVFLSGSGAEEFALTRGFELVPTGYFYTAERWRQLERIRGGDGGPLRLDHIARGNRRRGRLGRPRAPGRRHFDGRHDRQSATNASAIRRVIGAGTYADDRSCAVSATGHGEIFIRAAVAHDICARVRFAGQRLAQAVGAVVIEELPALRGEGGVIAIDPKGNIAMEFNSEGMFRASRRCGEDAANRHLSRPRPGRRRAQLQPASAASPRCTRNRPVSSEWYSASRTTTRFLPCSLALYSASSAS